MTAIQIPASIEDAITALNGIGQLLTAKRWERAAIVYAFTTNNGRGGDNRSSNGANVPLPMAEFAELGIIGLTDRHRVAAYRSAWEKAAAKVGESNAHAADEMLAISPGDGIDTPDLRWKDYYGESTREVQIRTAKAEIIRNPGIVREAMEVSDHVAETVTEHVAKDPDLSLRVDQHRYFGGSRSYQTDEHADRDRERMVARSFDERFRRVMREMTELALALREGRWKPLDKWAVDHAQRFFPELFREDPTPVIDQIEAFLAGEREVSK